MDWWTAQAAGLRGRIDRDEKLPWVHIAISKAKRFLLGTHHGVSHKNLQRYLDEFCNRFNRRSWEKQLTSRLLTACLYAHPITISELTA